MSSPIQSIFDRVSFAASHSVSASDVVQKIAFGFRLLSFAILAPLVVLGLMDVTAYVIARTLRAPKEKQRTPTKAPAITVEPSTSASGDSTGAAPIHSPSLPQMSPTQSIHGRPPAHGEPSWFKFPAADEKLSGVGMFSPPISRSTTPSNDRPGITSSFFMTSTKHDSVTASGHTPSPEWERVGLEDVPGHGQ